MKETVVYDKASYHYTGNYPSDLDPDQAFVHIGMFFGWLCERKLLTNEMLDDFPLQVALFLNRKITGPQLIRIAGGVITSDMLNEMGNAFCSAYFCHPSGGFVRDYFDVLAKDLPSIYHVSDTWINYEMLRNCMDSRYQQYLSENGHDP